MGADLESAPDWIGTSDLRFRGLSLAIGSPNRGIHPPPGGRRTQAERRSETRTALLDATIECLVTYGYSQTTTGRIAEVAGVSRGAQTMYFRTRAELVGAAVARLAEDRVKSVHDRFAKEEIPVPLEHALDVLWEEHQGPLFLASLEFSVASRTDPELARTLHKVEREVGDRLGGLAVQALGDVASRSLAKDSSPTLPRLARR